jgi:ectoine hydroxylase-related dioxygenase (phytanoyl-CoA dioxygenase family)
MKPLFRDPRLQEEADRNGYVIVRLLDQSQVEKLRSLYEESIDQTAISDLYESSRHNALETNRLINQAIRAEIERFGQELLEACQLYGGTFMVKSHKDSTILPLHQDWSVVEENEYATWFIWCPLQDVNAINGGIFLVEGSHKYFDALRSGTYPSDRYVLPHELERCLKSISLRAGEAILYSDRLFHGSHSNNSGEDRVVVTGRVIEQGGKLVYFHKKNQEEVDVYPADEAFYLSQIDSLAKGRPPSGLPKLYTRAYRHAPITEELLQTRINESLSALQQNPVECELFKDKALQGAFDRDGYVLIDLIGQEQVEELLSFYGGLDHAPMPEHGFQVSLDNRRPDFVRTVSEKLTTTVKRFVDDKFQNYRLFTASFVVKENNPHGVVPPHQDWTFVDEQKYWSATIWCTLVDAGIHNGALGLIRGSHRFYDHVRPSPSPQYEPPFKDQLFSIFPYLNIVDLRAGQAIVFNNRTLHASLPNTSDQTRVAFGLGITHRNAELQHFYLLPRQKKALVQRYEVQPEFFCTYNNARLSAMHTNGDQPSDLNSTGLFEYTCKRYDERQLHEMIEAAGNVRNDKFVETMAALFGHNLDGTKKDESGDHTADPVSGVRPSWWQVYTPTNIYREIHHRMFSRSEPLWKTYSPAHVVGEIKQRLERTRHKSI